MPNNLKLQKKFIDGSYKVFNKMFANDIVFRYLIESDSELNNVYNEGLVKAYGEPIFLTGRESITVDDATTPIEENRVKIKFDFPYKTFLLNNVDISLENHRTICQCIIEYLGKTYEIQKITPKTFVAGVYLFYSFDCVEKVKEYA